MMFVSMSILLLYANGKCDMCGIRAIMERINTLSVSTLMCINHVYESLFLTHLPKNLEA